MGQKTRLFISGCYLEIESGFEFESNLTIQISFRRIVNWKANFLLLNLVNLIYNNANSARIILTYRLVNPMYRMNNKEMDIGLRKTTLNIFNKAQSLQNTITESEYYSFT